MIFERNNLEKFNITEIDIILTDLLLIEETIIEDFMIWFEKISPKKKYLWLNPDLKNNCFHAIIFNFKKTRITITTPNNKTILFLIGKNPYKQLNKIKNDIGLTSINYRLSYVEDDINVINEQRDKLLCVEY